MNKKPQFKKNFSNNSNSKSNFSKNKNNSNNNSNNNFKGKNDNKSNKKSDYKSNSKSDKFSNKKLNKLDNSNVKPSFSKSKPKSNPNNKFQNKPKFENNGKKNSNRQILLDRYDKFFGFSAGRKLVESIRELSNNQFIRVNLTKSHISEVEDFLKKNRVKYETTFLPNAFKINKSFFNLTSSLFALSGKIYFQDLASQVPVNCVNFERLKLLSDAGKTIKVLDGCASPGSKTTQMLDLLNYYKINYELFAIELEKVRVNRLVNNIQKLGFENYKIFNVSASEFKTSEKFDLMILDVPCSGNLVGDRDWLNKRNVADICDKSNLQKSIVKNLSKYLKDDGELIYSTCSIEPEENEKNIKWIEQNCKLQNVKIDLKTPFESRCLDGVFGLRFLPFKSKTQGFFVARFVRK